MTLAPIFRRKILTPALPPLCRPAAWACLWRALGGFSVLSRNVPLCP